MRQVGIFVWMVLFVLMFGVSLVHAEERIWVEVNVSNQSLQLRNGDQVIQTYPVSTGKAKTPTPIGHFRIVSVSKNPGGPYGSAWLGLSKKHYGIHGTNQEEFIGTPVSAGCIRMKNKDVLDLMKQIKKGTSVRIIANPSKREGLSESGDPTKKTKRVTADKKNPKSGSALKPLLKKIIQSKQSPSINKPKPLPTPSPVSVHQSNPLKNTPLSSKHPRKDAIPIIRLTPQSAPPTKNAVISYAIPHFQSSQLIAIGNDQQPVLQKAEQIGKDIAIHVPGLHIESNQLILTDPKAMHPFVIITNKGQLIAGKRDKQPVWFLFENPKPSAFARTKSPFRKISSNIQEISLGAHHLLLLNHQQQALAIGCESALFHAGQCNVPKEPVRQIAAGFMHSAFLLQDERVTFTGKSGGAYSNQSLSDQDDAAYVSANGYDSVVVQASERIQKRVCYQKHCVSINDHQQAVGSFGENRIQEEHIQDVSISQLGVLLLQNHQVIWVTKNQIHLMKLSDIKRVIASDQAMAAIDEQGNAYVWAIQTAAIDVTALSNQFPKQAIKDLAFSNENLVVLCESGDVFVAGALK